MPPEAVLNPAAAQVPKLRRRLAVLAALACALLAFTRLGSEMAEGETRGFDSWALLALRHGSATAPPIGPAWLPVAAIDLTALGGTAVLTLVTVLGVGLVLAFRNWQRALFIAVAIGGGTALSGLLKLDYARPRPAIVAHLVGVSSASFPSGHAMNSAIVYLTLAALGARALVEPRARRYVIVVALLLTLLVGSTRVYLGVHWPTDVFAGWAAGGGWALLCWAVADALRSRGAAL